MIVLKCSNAGVRSSLQSEQSWDVLSTSSRATVNGNGLASTSSPAAQALRPHGEYAAGLDGSKGKVPLRLAAPSIQQMPFAAAMCAVCATGVQYPPVPGHQRGVAC